MQFRSLFIGCIFGGPLGILVALLAARDLSLLPLRVQTVSLKPLDANVLGNSQVARFIENWSSEAVAGAQSLQSAAQSSLALARAGAQERVFLGIGFANIFGLLAFQVRR